MLFRSTLFSICALVLSLTASAQIIKDTPKGKLIENLYRSSQSGVKKGTKPALKLENNRLVVQNGLQQVSPSIKPGVAVSESKATTSSSKSKGLDVMWLFCFLPAGILYLIFKQTDPKRRK